MSTARQFADDADFDSTPDPLVTVYSTTWCGYCTRLKRQMDAAGIAYAAVDIEETPDAEHVVRRVNNGNATVPTLVFRDGSALTNPSVAQVSERVSALRG